jgi:geranylgeranyl pyrophosphate synthase
MNIEQTSDTNFRLYLKVTQNRITTYLAHILPDSKNLPDRLHSAMRYTVLNGGKRIRPLLVYTTGAALGVDLTVLDLPAAAIELIHCYSLVHDDLPAMDNDELRRGQPTCHKAFDEATAILVGDALQTLAFELLSANTSLLPTEIRLKMINLLAKASGSLGMAGGQALDLQATGQKLTIHQLTLIHQLKTGALISAAIQLGILASNTDCPLKGSLAQFANKIGLCFQIQDDILNYEGTVKTLGKNAGTDLANQKATFATVEGVEQAKNSLRHYYQEAMHSLNPYSLQLKNLKALAEYIISRDH